MDGVDKVRSSQINRDLHFPAVRLDQRLQPRERSCTRPPTIDDIAKRSATYSRRLSRAESGRCDSVQATFRPATHPMMVAESRIMDDDIYTGTFCLSGGGPVKYTSKRRQRQQPHEHLVSLPKQQEDAKRERTTNGSMRHVSRSVPVMHKPARYTSVSEGRGSISAPGPNDHRRVGHHHTNHDRHHPTKAQMPRLPMINNLVNEPLQLQTYGTSTKTSSQRELGGKRWATSLANARANTTPNDDTRRSECYLSSHRNSPEKSPSGKALRPSDGSLSKGLNEDKTGDENSVSTTKVTRTDTYDPSNPEETLESRNKLSPTKDRTLNSTQKHPESKTSPTRGKSTAILTKQPINESTNRFVRQTSESGQPSTTESAVKTEPNGSPRNTTVPSRGPAGSRTKKRPFRKPVIITKKSLLKQKTLTSIYGNRTFKGQRQIRVLQKMEDVQRKEVAEYNKDLKEKDQTRMQSVVKQRMALKRVRDRFDEEQVRRFRNQYVSWRSVEEDRLKRSSETYGLPDFIYEDLYEKTLKKIPESNESASKKKKPKTFKKYATWVRNIKAFERMLAPNVGGNMDEAFKQNKKAIVEGIDTVKLDSGGSKRAKKVNVKRLIGSAQKLLKVPEPVDDISEVSSYQDDDSGESDSSVDLSGTDP